MIRVNLSGFYDWAGAKPFPHVVIDGFFEPALAREIAAEFPPFDRGHDSIWHRYDNPLEVKLTLNDWNRFGPATYRAFSRLCSADFVELLRLSIHADYPLYADHGLHGGGLHAHAAGGRLNTHLDYSLHPKTGLARKLNLIVYLNEDWQEEWGGHLGLYEQSPVQIGPGALHTSIVPVFNRAVLFDTVGSWHGLPNPIACPQGQVRKSLAVYYMADPAAVPCDTRSRALFAPHNDQLGDPAIAELIRLRASETTAQSVHRVADSACASARTPQYFPPTLLLK